MTLEEIWKEYVKEKGTASVSFTPPGSTAVHYAVQLRGQKALWEACAVPVEEENLFVFYVRADMQTPEEKRALTAKRLMEYNYSLKLASFQIEPRTGEITARACAYMFGTLEEKLMLIDNALNLCGLAMDSCADEIAELVKR